MVAAVDGSVLNRGVMVALQVSGESRTGETLPGVLVRVQSIQFVIAAGAWRVNHDW